MARLSDFQQPATPRSTAADALMSASSSKIRKGGAMWRNTKVVASEGYQEQPLYQLEQAFDAGNRRSRLHRALDQVLNDVEINDDDEPAEQDDDEEPQEASGAWIQSVQRQLDAILHGSDSDALDVGADLRRDRERQRHVVVDRGAARVIPSQHRVKIDHRAGYVNDAAYISKFLHPDMLCVEAENQLHDISLQRQADDSARGFWSGLFFFLRDQPEGSRIRDIKNQVCLSTLLSRTLGGQTSPFGV